MNLKSLLQVSQNQFKHNFTQADTITPDIKKQQQQKGRIYPLQQKNSSPYQTTSMVKNLETSIMRLMTNNQNSIEKILPQLQVKPPQTTNCRNYKVDFELNYRVEAEDNPFRYNSYAREDHGHQNEIPNMKFITPLRQKVSKRTLRLFKKDQIPNKLSVNQVNQTVLQTFENELSRYARSHSVQQSTHLIQYTGREPTNQVPLSITSITYPQKDVDEIYDKLKQRYPLLEQKKKKLSRERLCSSVVSEFQAENPQEALDFYQQDSLVTSKLDFQILSKPEMAFQDSQFMVKQEASSIHHFRPKLMNKKYLEPLSSKRKNLDCQNSQQDILDSVIGLSDNIDKQNLIEDQDLLGSIVNKLMILPRSMKKDSSISKEYKLEYLTNQGVNLSIEQIDVKPNILKRKQRKLRDGKSSLDRTIRDEKSLLDRTSRFNLLMSSKINEELDEVKMMLKISNKKRSSQLTRKNGPRDSVKKQVTFLIDS